MRTFPSPAIEKLYTIFASYSKPATIEGCPCCVSDADKDLLHSKPLRELLDADLSRYTFKAITTWGGVDDFRHYLPRILELSAQGELITDNSVVLGKLEYGRWKDWPPQEQSAIIHFVAAWWNYSSSVKEEFDADLFSGIFNLTSDIHLLLQNWKPAASETSLAFFADFVFNNYNTLTSGNDFLQFDLSSRRELINWMLSQKNHLEDAFFRYEKSNPSLAELISNALFLLDTHK